MKMDGINIVGNLPVYFPMLGTHESGPFVLKGAEGLGPPERTVRMARTTNQRAKYQGASTALRQVTMLVGVNPNYDEGQTAEQLRRQIYGLLTPRYNQLARLEITHRGITQGLTYGQVSSITPALFTKDPAVQVVFDSDYTYFEEPDEEVQDPVPGANGGLSVFQIENIGDAPASFKADFILGSGVPATLILTDADPRGNRIQIEGIDWNAGDRFVVDTREGSRGVWRGPNNGALVSVLNNLNADVSSWMQLYPGTNTLRFSSLAFTWGPEFKFRYRPAFWGV